MDSGTLLQPVVETTEIKSSETKIMKKCKACAMEKDISEYYERRKSRGVETVCKKCYNKLGNKSYTEDEKEKIKKGEPVGRKVGILRNKYNSVRKDFIEDLLSGNDSVSHLSKKYNIKPPTLYRWKKAGMFAEWSKSM